MRAIIQYVSGIRIWTPKAKYTPDGWSIAQCEACYTLVRMHAGMSLIRHLTEDHKLDAEATYETVRWIFKKIDVTIRRMRLPKDVR